MFRARPPSFIRQPHWLGDVFVLEPPPIGDLITALREQRCDELDFSELFADNRLPLLKDLVQLCSVLASGESSSLKSLTFASKETIQRRTRGQTQAFSIERILENHRQLESLTIREPLGQLSFIDVRSMCEGLMTAPNRLTTLDICTTGPHVTLETICDIIVAIPTLQSLSLSGRCASAQNMAAVEHLVDSLHACSNLQRLSVIGVLVVPLLFNLEHAKLRHLHLGGVAKVRTIADSRSSSAWDRWRLPSLQDLTIVEGLDDDDFRRVVAVLSKAKHSLRSVKLVHCPLSIASIGQSAQVFNELESCEFICPALSDAVAWAKALLSANANLTKLIVAVHELDSLLQTLGSDSCRSPLALLDLSGSLIFVQKPTIVDDLRAVLHKDSLQTLILDRCHLGWPLARAVTDFLGRPFMSVSMLSLERNSLYGESLALLFEALATNKTLVGLSLAENHWVCASTLKGALPDYVAQQQKTAEELPDVLASFQSAMTLNTSLRYLSLRGVLKATQPLDEVFDLALACLSSSSLEYVDFRGNCPTQQLELCAAIEPVLAETRKVFNLGSTPQPSLQVRAINARNAANCVARETSLLARLLRVI